MKINKRKYKIILSASITGLAISVGATIAAVMPIVLFTTDLGLSEILDLLWNG